MMIITRKEEEHITVFITEPKKGTEHDKINVKQ